MYGRSSRTRGGGFLDDLVGIMVRDGSVVFRARRSGAVSPFRRALAVVVAASMLVVGASVVDPAVQASTGQLADPSPPAFSDVTAQAGIDAIGPSWGVAWGDVDGDGLPDLWLPRHGQQARLYINDGDGTFTDHGASVFGGDRWDAHGGAFADFDDDGDLDLFVMADNDGIAGAPNRLFENRDGTGLNWTDIGSAVGVDSPRSRGRMPMWLDMGNDGDLDLIAPSKRRSTDTIDDTATNTQVFMQGPVGQFDSSILTSEPVLSSLALADVTLDGPPVLLVPLIGSAWPTIVLDHRCEVSADITSTVGLPTSNALDVAVGDFDGDLVSDLYFVRGEPQDGFAQTSSTDIEGRVTKGAGTKGLDITSAGQVEFSFGPAYKFREFPTELRVGAAGTLIATPAEPLVLDPHNPDHQGLPADLGQDPVVFVGYDVGLGQWQVRYHRLPSGLNTIAVASDPIIEFGAFGLPSEAAYRGRLWMNDGAGDYIDRSHQVSLSQPSYGRSAVTGDFDNDGDLDIYLSGAETTTNRRNTLLTNNGAGHFTEVPNAGGAGGTTTLGRGDGAAAADFDGDGFLDLVVANGKSDPPFDADGPTQLFLNEGNTNHWIQMDLVGRHGNAHGIGAVVRVTANGVTQHRLQDGGTHYRGQNGHRVHVGLGASTTIETIEVRWPSGLTSTRRNVPVDRVLTVIEPDRPPKIVGCESAHVEMPTLEVRSSGTNPTRHRIVVTGTQTETTVVVDVVATEPFVSVTGLRLEDGADSFTVDGNRMRAELRVGTGTDALDIVLPPGAKAAVAAAGTRTEVPMTGWVVRVADIPPEQSLTVGVDSGLYVGRLPGQRVRFRLIAPPRSAASFWAGFSTHTTAVGHSLEGSDSLLFDDDSVFASLSAAQGNDYVDATLAGDAIMAFGSDNPPTSGLPQPNALVFETPP